MLVDLEDHGAGGLVNGVPCVVGNAQAAVTGFVRRRNRHKGHIHTDHAAAVQRGQRAQNGGHKADKAAALQLALIVTDMPAVIVESGLLGVTFHNLDARADHQTAADLDIVQLFFSGGKGTVQKIGKACAEAVIHPIAALHGHNGLFGGYKFLFQFTQHSFAPLIKIRIPPIKATVCVWGLSCFSRRCPKPPWTGRAYRSRGTHRSGAPVQRACSGCSDRLPLSSSARRQDRRTTWF